MKRLSSMVSMAMLVPYITSCDFDGDAILYGVNSSSLEPSADLSFTEKTRFVNEAEYEKVDSYQVIVNGGDDTSLHNGLYKDMSLSVSLTTGKEYTVKVFYGDNVDISLDKLCVEDGQGFIIGESEQKNITLYCKPADVKVSVVHTEDFLKCYLNCTVSPSASHLIAPFEINMRKDSDKNAYLKANADSEDVSITVRSFKDREGNTVVMETLTAKKEVTPKMYLTITVDSKVITASIGTASLDVTVNIGTEDKDVDIEIPGGYWPGNANR